MHVKGVTAEFESQIQHFGKKLQDTELKIGNPAQQRLGEKPGIDRKFSLIMLS